MKRISWVLLAAITIAVLTSSDRCYGQDDLESLQIAVEMQLESAKTSSVVRASDALAKNLKDVLDGKTPLEIYPPEFLDWLNELGDEPMLMLESGDSFALTV